MKTLDIIKNVFTVVGAGMLIGAFFLYQNTSQFIEKSIETQGIVVDFVGSDSSNSSDISMMYKSLVEFTDTNGTQIEFLSSTSSNTPSYNINEKVDVIYIPEYPNEAKIKSFFSLWGGATILGTLGLVFFIIGGSIIAYNMTKKNTLEYLKLNGIKIKTDFQRVRINPTMAVNGRTPFVVVSEWKNPKTSKLHVFTSDNVWFDPTDLIKTDKINVLIDRNNPKKYSVDLSFLPKVSE